MSIRNTTTSYGSVTKALHWIISVMIITMLIVGFTMINMEPSSEKNQIYNLHKATGLLVLMLVSIRLLWRLTNSTVELSRAFPQWQKKAFQINIGLLYALMFVMPISGFLMTAFAHYNINFYGLFTINPFVEKNIKYALDFRSIHQTSTYIFWALLI